VFYGRKFSDWRCLFNKSISGCFDLIPQKSIIILMETISESLRKAMRHWTTGVSVVTSQSGNHQHGMTVNSLTSVSLDPPLVVVTLANGTRTCELVRLSSVFGVTILAADQGAISDRFAGRDTHEENRFAGLDTFTLSSDVPFLRGGLAFLDCRAIFSYPLPNSTLFIGEVIAVESLQEADPLVYHNRVYRRLEP
jgi:flavin reductase (DIM6/NTAB) family NADH-FMN oxidoreductase RutF